MPDERLIRLRGELREELTQRILPYWLTRTVDKVNGGFIGSTGHDNRPVPAAPKGSILHSRILWTFSAAYRTLGNEEYLTAASHAAAFIERRFCDNRYGGVYWMLDARGKVTDDRKHVYAQAFAIYALAEYHLATGNTRELDAAIKLFELVEHHAHDERHGGYEEAFTRNWVRLADVRLSDKDANERKSMNTHLHVLEAYTNLYRAWPDRRLRKRLYELVAIFLTRIVNEKGGTLTQFFDSDWTPRSCATSFGHDIEATWLLLEAADVLGDAAVRERARTAGLVIARAVMQRAVDEDGGLMYESRDDRITDHDKHWWPQAEAVVGFVSAYEESGDEAFLQAAIKVWDFTRRHVVDAEHGEWHERVDRQGNVYAADKTGPWKCPYHNTRMCLEIMRRAGDTGKTKAAAATG